LGSNLIACLIECKFFLIYRSPIGIYPGKVRLVCLAPLTNIALALKTYAEFSANLKDIYVMGGNSTGKMNEVLCFKQEMLLK
jgi:inosine-uridine nucleoside N-ribohydrolase